MVPFRILLVGYLVMDAVIITAQLWLHGKLPGPVEIAQGRMMAQSTLLLLAVGLPLSFDVLFLGLPLAVYPVLKQNRFGVASHGDQPASEADEIQRRKEYFFRLFAVLLGLGIVIKIAFVLAVYEWYASNLGTDLPLSSLRTFRWIIAILLLVMLPLVGLLMRHRSQQPSSL